MTAFFGKYLGFSGFQNSLKTDFFPLSRLISQKIGMPIPTNSFFTHKIYISPATEKIRLVEYSNFEIFYENQKVGSNYLGNA